MLWAVIRLGVAGFVAVALLLLGLAAMPFETVRERLDQLAGDGSAEPYTVDVHARLQTGGVILGLTFLSVLAIAWRWRRELAVLMTASAGRLRCEGHEYLTAASAFWRETGVPVLLWTGIGAGLRLLYLNQPMRFDESYTWLQYARWPWYVAISRYDAPNNHLLHTLLVNLTTSIAGDSPLVIRVPAFVAGCALVPAGMLWAWSMSGRTAAMLMGALLACSSPLVEYSTNARGYTLIGLFTCLQIVLMQRLFFRSELLGWLLWIVFGALGCWTVPAMIYPLAAVLGMVLAACVHPGLWRHVRAGLKWELVVAVCFVGMLTTLLYVPVLVTTGLQGFLATLQSERLPWSGFAAAYPRSLSASTALLLRDHNVVGLLLLAAGTVIGLGLGTPTNRSLRQCLLLGLCVSLAVPVLQRTIPFARLWLFAIPWLCALASMGLGELLNLLGQQSRRRMMPVLLAIFAVLPAYQLVREESVLRSRETGTAPDAESMVRDLPGLVRVAEPVLAIVPVSAPLTYYAFRTSLDETHLNPQHWNAEGESSVVVVVSTPTAQDQELVRQTLRDFGREGKYDLQTSIVLKTYPAGRIYRLFNKQAVP